MTFQELSKKHADELYKFPCAFAICEEQVPQALAELGLTDTKQAVHIFGGMIIRKADEGKWRAMQARHAKNLEEARKDP